MDDRNDVVRVMGERIRTAREALAMSQNDLARLLGKTQNTISNYESGVRAVHVGELPALASVLKVTISYFYGDDYVNEQILELLSKLIPSFRYSIQIVIEEQLGLQTKLLEALTKAGVIVTPEQFEESGILVQLKDLEVRKAARDAFLSAVDEMLRTTSFPDK